MSACHTPSYSLAIHAVMRPFRAPIMWSEREVEASAPRRGVNLASIEAARGIRMMLVLPACGLSLMRNKADAYATNGMA